MKVELDVDESYATMFEQLEELPDADAREELAEILEPHAENAIHEAFQYHKHNGNL